MASFYPRTAEDVAAAVRWAMAEAAPLEILAGGSKRGLGRPSQAEHTLDVSALSGIVAYEPAELVLTAAAATPMAEIETAVAASGQMLAFEPPDWRDLLGSADRTPTLGGTISCSLAGPRRIKAGSARDHLLGFSGVNGRGEIFKSGGRVVKNVTGYDLCKLVTGAYGTLAVLTELSIKVLPRPETSRSILVPGLADEAAIVAMAEALNAPHEVSAAAHLPGDVARRSSLACDAATVLRIEGPAPSVAFRSRELQAMFPGASELPKAESTIIWYEIANVSLLAEPRTAAIWRLSVPPSQGARIAASVAQAGAYFFDWGGGLLWLASEAPDGGASAIAEALRAVPDSHATLIRGPDGLRASVDVFQKLPAPLASLSARVKKGFDPLGVLNPGRMYAGV